MSKQISHFFKSIYNCQISFVVLRPSGKSSAVSCPYGLSFETNFARDKVSPGTKCPLGHNEKCPQKKKPVTKIRGTIFACILDTKTWAKVKI